jgi:hypothetical protein
LKESRLIDEWMTTVAARSVASMVEITSYASAVERWAGRVAVVLTFWLRLNGKDPEKGGAR